MRIRERHLTEDTTKAVIQAIGVKILLTIPSERETIQIEIPITSWKTSEAKNRTLLGTNKGAIAVGIFEDVMGQNSVIPATIRTIENDDEILQ